MQRNYGVMNTFCLFPIGASECENIIASLKKTKTVLSTVSVRLLKSVSKTVSYWLSRIITLSFVTSLFKKGDSFDSSNYIPISSLSYISKTFEKCVKVGICSFFKKYQNFSSSQYGFFNGVNTAHAKSDFTEYLYQALNDKEHAWSVFVDLRKASDTVFHEILLCKLECYGVGGVGLKYFRRN